MPPAIPQAGHRDAGSVENWLGGKALGVAAAVLVFMGLVTLGLSFIPTLDAFAKSMLMLGISGALAGMGSVLVLRNRSVFSEALVGCGMGSLFISLLVTHLRFNMVGDLTAFALMLAWTAACAALIAKTRSTVLVAVMQVGLFASLATYATVLFPLLGGWRNATFSLLLGYEAVAMTIVVMANVLLFNNGRKTLGMTLMGVDAALAVMSFPAFEEVLAQPYIALLGAYYVAGLGLCAGFMVARAQAKPAGIVWFAVACTLLVMAYQYYCLPTVVPQYQGSLFLLTSAVACIAVGFRLPVGGLRLYGLALTLASVANIVFIGSYGVDPLTRFVALVTGGATCFAISALYNYACRRNAMREENA